MANKYKVGDRVKLVGDSFSIGNKKRLYGKTDVIREVRGSDYPYCLTENTMYCWRDEELEPACENKIVITTDGKTTLARLYDGSKVIKSAEAKCSPEDTFDFAVGAKIAYDRLMGIPVGEEKKEVKPTESLENVTWKVVKRPAKAGDYVRIVSPNFSFDRKGDVLKVSKAVGDGIFVKVKDHPNGKHTYGEDFEWCYMPHYYEVVEKVETPEFKVGDRVIITDTNIGDGYNGEIGVIVEIDLDYHYPYAVHTPKYKGGENNLWSKVKALTYKPGDRVRIIKDTCCHNIKNGTVVTLKSKSTWGCGGHKDAWDIEGYWVYVRETDIEPYIEPTTKYKSGDKVKVIGKTCGHYASIGEIITLTKNNVLSDPKKWNYSEHLGYITENDIEPYTPVVVNGFKVGDRVNYNGHNGTVICIHEDDDIGVEFDERWTNNHNCMSNYLKDGKCGTKNTSWWINPKNSDLKHGELVGYNGKVVCVKSDGDFKVGKVYEIVNGVLHDEMGNKRPEPTNPNRRIKSLEDGWLDSPIYKFIPYVE